MEQLQTATEKNIMATLTTIKTRTVKGAQIAGVRNYKNKKGEVSNYSLVMGYDHAAMKAAELQELQALELADLESLPFDNDVIKTAHAELLAARLKPTKDNPHAMGQIDAYESLAQGLRVHKDTGSVKVMGLCLSKKVLVAIPAAEKKAVKSSAKTLAKRAIERHINAKNKRAFGKIVQFDIDKGQYALQGDVV